MSDIFNKAYALLIGIGESAYTRLSLPATVRDVQALKKVLCDPQLCGYAETNVHLLHDEIATKHNILDSLDWLKNCAEQDTNSTILIFYSGHGWRKKSNSTYYLLQHDIDPIDLESSALDAQLFTNKLQDIQSNRLLVIIDSCHAQGMASSKGNKAIKVPEHFEQTALPKGFIDKLKQGSGRAIFTSSRGTQSSYVRQEKDLSLYTYHLIEALQGANNKQGDSYVYLSNLMNHLNQAVQQSAQLMGVEQTPFFDFTTEDFPVALLLGGKGLPSDNPVKEQFSNTSSTQLSQAVSGEGHIFTGSGDIHIHSPLKKTEKIDVDIGRLPEPSTVLQGRQSELAQLDSAFENDSVCVAALIAPGGVGKSAIIDEWLNRMEDKNYRTGLKSWQRC